MLGGLTAILPIAANTARPAFSSDGSQAFLEQVDLDLAVLRKRSEERAARQARDFESFKSEDEKESQTDCSTALQNAARWSAVNALPVIVRGQHLLSKCAVLSEPGATLIFADCEFLVKDDMPYTKTKFGEFLPLGMLVTASDISLTGKCTLTGLGEPGNTYLQGIYCEESSGLVLGDFSFNNMAIGMHVMCCDRFQCGLVTANSMWGLQDRANPNGAGSAQVVSGCRWSHFDQLVSLHNDKPARYLSIGKHSKDGFRDNSRNIFEKVYVTGRVGSPWSQATGIRSSVDSKFAGGVGNNVSVLLLCQSYAKDTAFNIDGNQFGKWEGTIIDSSGNTDCGGFFHVEKGAKPIGRNHIDSLRVSSGVDALTFIERTGIRNPNTYGLYCSSGELHVQQASFSGNAVHLYARQSSLLIANLYSLDPLLQSLWFGTQASVDIGEYHLSLSALEFHDSALLQADFDEPDSATHIRIKNFRYLNRDASPEKRPILAPDRPQERASISVSQSNVEIFG